MLYFCLRSGIVYFDLQRGAYHDIFWSAFKHLFGHKEKKEIKAKKIKKKYTRTNIFFYELTSLWVSTSIKEHHLNAGRPLFMCIFFLFFTICDETKALNSEKNHYYQRIVCKAPFFWLEYTTARLALGA